MKTEYSLIHIKTEGLKVLLAEALDHAEYMGDNPEDVKSFFAKYHTNIPCSDGSEYGMMYVEFDPETGVATLVPEKNHPRN